MDLHILTTPDFLALATAGSNLHPDWTLFGPGSGSSSFHFTKTTGHEREANYDHFLGTHGYAISPLFLRFIKAN